ncbi:MAG: hypothetical protein WKF71_19170 [Pyrinomonadaceae bacterium]
MLFKKKLLIALALLLLIFSFSASAANANGGEYKKIVSHLKTKYRAKKVKIPFMFLARFAVSVVRPAGMKSFSVTLFEDLKFSRETLNAGNADGNEKLVRRGLESDSPRAFTHWRTGLYVYARSGQAA